MKWLWIKVRVINRISLTTGRILIATSFKTAMVGGGIWRDASSVSFIVEPPHSAPKFSAGSSVDTLSFLSRSDTISSLIINDHIKVINPNSDGSFDEPENLVGERGLFLPVLLSRFHASGTSVVG